MDLLNEKWRLLPTQGIQQPQGIFLDKVNDGSQRIVFSSGGEVNRPAQVVRGAVGGVELEGGRYVAFQAEQRGRAARAGLDGLLLHSRSPDLMLTRQLICIVDEVFQAGGIVPYFLVGKLYVGVELGIINENPVLLGLGKGVGENDGGSGIIKRVGMRGVEFLVGMGWQHNPVVPLGLGYVAIVLITRTAGGQ